MSVEIELRERLTRIEEKIVRLDERVDSLARAVQGMETEGNIGLIRAFQRQDERLAAVSKRVESNRENIRTIKIWASAAAAVGGGIGAAIAIVADAYRIAGGLG